MFGCVCYTFKFVYNFTVFVHRNHRTAIIVYAPVMSEPVRYVFPRSTPLKVFYVVVAWHAIFVVNPNPCGFWFWQKRFCHKPVHIRPAMSSQIYLKMTPIWCNLRFQ